MKKSLKILALAVALAAGGAPLAQAAPLTVSSEKSVLFVTENVTPGGSVNISATTGPLTTSERGFGLGRLGNKVAPGRIPVSIPAITFSGWYGTPTGLPTRGAVLDQANARIRANFNNVKSGLSSYMQTNGISSSWFTFKQEVQVDANGVAETWAIHWDYFADKNGRGAYADARLVSPDPKVLYLVYTPLRVDSDLPQSWSYPDGGTMKYQLRDMKFDPVTDWATLNAGGAYDAPQGGSENTDDGVNCLMDSSTAGCAVGPTDVKKLLDSTGAVMAVVDYVRRVQPQWVEQPDGSVVPKMATSIDAREVSYVGCFETNYRNRGNFGYTLQTNLGRYIAVSSGSPRVVNYQQLQEYEGTYLSPNTPYDYTIRVRKGDVPALGSYAIDPVKGGVLLPVADIPGLVSVAGVNVLNTPQDVVGSATGGIWQYGGARDSYQVIWTLKCSKTVDGFDIETVIQNTRNWPSWSSSAKTLSAVGEGYWSAVGLAGFNGARYLAMVDRNAGLVRLTEGTHDSRYSYRASGGGEGGDSGFVCGHNNYSMHQPWRNNYECENKNLWDFDCGYASKPADVYVGGVYNRRITQNRCTGSTHLRGFYMDSGAPYWEAVPISQKDLTTAAYWWCKPADQGGACGWRLDEGGSGGGGGGKDGPITDQPEQQER